MNQQFRPADLSDTTQAAEGLPRRRWSLAEIEAMVAAGILLEDDRFELIGGEVVPMSPKGNRHELMKAALNLYWAKLCPEGVQMVPETTLRVNKDTFHEPDFVFYLAKDGLVNLSPKTVQLAVEVSDTSLGFDLHHKVQLYAVYGIQEVWVIDVDKMVTHVHRRPLVQGYSEVFQVEVGDEVVPIFAPKLAVKLSELVLI
jgi:Uma2 family endonuclease